MNPLRKFASDATQREMPERCRAPGISNHRQLFVVAAMTKDYLPYSGPIVTLEEARQCRLARYFTGEPCSKGHLSQRQASNSSCIECNRLNHVRRSHANPERYKEKWRKRISSNREHHNAYQREWRKKNGKKQKEIKQRAYAKNAEKQRAYSRKYHYDRLNRLQMEGENRLATHLEIQRQKTKQWVKDNPDKASALSRNKRAKRAAAPGLHTAENIRVIRIRQKGRCAIGTCRADLSRVGEHVDHITPIARGGTNWPKNLQLLCPPCNLAKHAKDPIDFMRERGFLL